MGNKKGIIYYWAIYARLSKEDGDKEESESITNQIHIDTDCIEQLKLKEPENTFIFVGAYIDDGYSGTNFDRPDFKRLIGDIENKKVNLVVTKNLDRLGRNTSGVLYYYEDYFPEKNVRYMTALEEKIDTSKENDDDIGLKYKMVGDEYYPRKLSRNIKATKRRNVKSVFFNGSIAPYGYKKSPTNKYQLIIDEEVAPIIKKIFSMYASGYTRLQIVDELNNLGVPPPRKHLNMEKTEKGLYGVDKTDFSWKEHTITMIVGNAVYIGTIVGAKTYKPNFKKKTRKTNLKENQIVVPNKHEAIIDFKTFEKCQEIREKHLDKSCKYDNVFKGIVFCGECGSKSNLKHKSKIKKDGSTCEIYSYLCSEANKGSRKECNNTKSISAKKLYDIIYPKLKEQCKSILVNDVDIKNIINNVTENVSYEIKRLENECNSYREKINKVNDKIKATYKDKLNNIITQDFFVEMQQELQKEIEKYKSLLENTEKELEREKTKQVISFDEVQEIAKKFIENENINKELLHKLVKRIELDSNRNLKVQFTFADMLKEVC